MNMKCPKCGHPGAFETFCPFCGWTKKAASKEEAEVTVKETEEED